MADRFPIILNTSANQLQEIASGDTLDISDAAIKTNLVDSKSVVGTGVSIVGVVTATSFVGSGANLTNIDVTAVKDSGGNVKIQAQDSGAIYTGIHTFGSTTSFTSGVFNGTVTATGAVVNGDTDLNGDIDVDGHTELDNVNVAGVTTFNEDISFKGANYDFLYDRSLNTLKFDQGIAAFGTSGQMTLQNTTITGVANIKANGLYIRNTSNQQMISCYTGGRIELYFNNSKKLDTTNTGIDITGNVVGDGLTIDGDSDLNGDLDVDGHTNLDNVSVAGVTTFAGAINGSSAAFTGNVSVGGVLTYEDVKNVDSVGVATARTGLKVLAGGANVVGVVTASNGIFVPDNQTIHLGNASGSGDLRLYHGGSHSYISDQGTGSLQILTDSLRVNNAANNQNMIAADEGAAVTLRYAGSDKLATSNTGVTITGNATATTFIGALTGTASGNTTISNNADNRVVTGGSGNALNGEANLTYNGNNLQFNTTANGHAVILKSTGNYYNLLSFDSGNTSAGGELAYVDFKWDGTKVADIQVLAGSDTTNKDDGQLVFRTSPSQGSITERIRITQSGQTLVGSTTDIFGEGFKLQVADTGAYGSLYLARFGNGSLSSYLRFGKSRNGTIGSHTIVQSGDVLGAIDFTGSGGSSMHNAARINCQVDNTPGNNDMPGRIQFQTTPDGGTTPLVRMTIKSTGRVGINESDPSEMLYVAGNIYATGNVTAYSDIRVKENVKEISNALEAVDKIRGVSYTRKDTKEDTLGVSAQEVESMFPELVVEDNHGMKSVNYNGLVGVLFSAVKELSTKLKEIEDK